MHFSYQKRHSVKNTLVRFITEEDEKGVAKRLTHIIFTDPQLIS